MTTKALMISEIIDDIARDDLTTAIVGGAIDRACLHYQKKRFYFNESRTPFSTVIGTSSYPISTVAPVIPEFYELDDVMLVLNSTNERELEKTEKSEIDRLLRNGATSGPPTRYCYFAQSFLLYPTPDAVYSIRPSGFVKLALPASDGEINNKWFTEAYDLIHCRAKGQLSVHKTMDTEMAQIMSAAEQNAYSALRSATTSQQDASSGDIVAMDF